MWQSKEVAALSALAIPMLLFRLISITSHRPEPIDQPGSLLPFSNPSSQASVLKEWRNVDWICKCGFHSYSSRIQCKNCNEAAPVNLGTKRLGSEPLAHEWDRKRLNQGYTSMQPHSAIYSSFPGISPGSISNWQLSFSFLQQHSTTALLGKGLPNFIEQNNGVMETGCAQIARIIIMHLDQSAIGARLNEISLIRT